MKKKNILVTGGTGFLGRHVQEKFKRHEKDFNIRYEGSRYNLCSEASTKELFDLCRPDIVVHMAAVCGGILANKNAPADFLTKNLQMGINIFESARKFNVKNVYTLGSACSYPKFCKAPFHESYLWNGYPEETNAPYGISKRALLMMSKTYREQYGVEGMHLIPVNLYGEHDHFDLVNSHVIPALINKFVGAVKNNYKNVDCWGDGEVTREFIYAGDAARAIVHVATKQLDYVDPVNIGTGKSISIKDLAKMIASIVGYKGKITFTNEVSSGQPFRRLDVRRAEEILDFKATTSLLDGLRLTVDWYKRNK